MREEVDLLLDFKGHRERITFSICELGKVDVIIGHTWLSRHNPEVDWISGEVKLTRCPPSCGRLFAVEAPHQVAATGSKSQQLAEKAA